jgi:hypothetical protein
MMNPENNASINFVSPELKEWVPAEYEAGYAARFADASESLPGYRRGRGEEFTDTWFTLYDIGSDAHVN